MSPVSSTLARGAGDPIPCRSAEAAPLRHDAATASAAPPNTTDAATATRPRGAGSFKDNNCNDLVDDDPVDGTFVTSDADGDGFGDPDGAELGCSGDGVDNTLDCNDRDSSEPQVVDASHSGSSDGSAARPWTSIQDGIDGASGCVVVYAGTYDEAIDFSGKDISVIAVDGPTETTIDATGKDSPAVTFSGGESSDALLVGFTITGGEGNLTSSSSSYSCGSGDTCTDYVTTYCGGGIYIKDSSPSLLDLSIVDNALAEPSTTTSGGDNYYVSSFGGGLCLENASPSTRALRVFGNYAGTGGGVYVDENSTADLHQVSIVGNSAEEGAGVAVDSGTVGLVNALVSWNTATGNGGGLLAADADANVMNSTLGGNEAPSGAGIGGAGTARVMMMNSIVYGSVTGYGINFESTAGFNGTYNDVYNNDAGEYNGVDDTTGTSGNISEDPKFVDVTDDGDAFNDDWHLSGSSPAADAGNPDSTYNDVDGSTNDMGAFGGPDGAWAP